MKTRSAALLALLATALAGCGSDTASFMIDDSDTALTLERIKDYPWSNWQVELVVRHHPDCQRRYPLKSTGNDNLKIELFTPAPYVFIIKQGKRWYVTETKDCRLQPFPEPPPEPGEPVGAFQVKNGVLKFVAQTGAARQ